MKSGRHELLVIEDDEVLGGALMQRLKLEDFAVFWAKTCAQGLAELKRARPDFVLADIRLPDGSGEDLLRNAMPLLGDTPILFATAFGQIDQAIRLVRAGADDYLTKPYDIDELVERIRARLAGRQAVLAPAEDTFGLSAATLTIADMLRRIADTRIPVLLSGETGTGKEVAARYLHRHSAQALGPFVAVNCGAVPGDLLESQFFGHERGAFTGAVSTHVGFFEEAAGGTLFLDEIGELDPKLQTALLRVLQEHCFRRVGARKDLQFEGRIVAATNANLQEKIAARDFREDLYYRLAVVELALPPLRERTEEIRPLAERFVQIAAERCKRKGVSLSADAFAALQAYRWPGNVRELRNRIERAVALSRHLVITPSDLFTEDRLNDGPVHTLGSARERAEFQQIELVLEECGGRLSDAAKRLGVSRTTLWKRLKKYEAVK